jgi:hypothetical protein
MSKITPEPKSRKEHDQMKRGKMETASQEKPSSKGILNEKCSRLCGQCKNLLGLK